MQAIRIFCCHLVCGFLCLSATIVFADDANHARKLINSQGCKACHALEGDGSSWFFSFAEMRDKLSRKEIRAMLVNDKKQHGNPKIRDFSHLSAQDIQVLVNFIQPEE